MGNVSIVYKILPQDVELDIEEVRTNILKALENRVKVRGSQVKPIAFGLNSILLAVLVNDEENASEKIELLIRSVKGVGEVEVEDLTLI